MSTMSAEQLAGVSDFLRQQCNAGNVSLKEIMGLAEVMAAALRTHFQQIDVAIYQELGDMAREITTMKEKLVELRIADMRNDRIPAAGRELDAIVDATETATNTIMTAAEAIMCADPSDHDGYQAVVNDNVVKIFEACSFQDITGQRISKVVSTLNHLDGRITRLVDRLKQIRIDEPDLRSRRPPRSAASANSSSTARSCRAKASARTTSTRCCADRPVAAPTTGAASRG